MPLTDRAQAQDEPEPARREARLVGMRDDGRVEQGGRLDRVLVGEPGTHEVAALVGQRGVVRYPVGDPLVVGPQYCREVAVPFVKRSRTRRRVASTSSSGSARMRPNTPDARDRLSCESS